MADRKPRKRAKSKYERDLEGFIEQYIQHTGDTEWSTHKVADWLIKTGQWEDQKINATRFLSRQLARAAREATITDDDGNQIRKYHAFRLGPQQPMLWSEIDLISPENMNESKTMRRNKLAAGAIQLHLDLKYYNAKVNPGEAIEFDPDFTNDISEREHSSEYDDTPPEE